MLLQVYTRAVCSLRYEIVALVSATTNVPFFVFSRVPTSLTLNSIFFPNNEQLFDNFVKKSESFNEFPDISKRENTTYPFSNQKCQLAVKQVLRNSLILQDFEKVIRARHNQSTTAKRSNRLVSRNYKLSSFNSSMFIVAVTAHAFVITTLELGRTQAQPGQQLGQHGNLLYRNSIVSPNIIFHLEIKSLALVIMLQIGQKFIF